MIVNHYTPISNSKKKGCPTCDGISPKTCMRCMGKTRLCDWYRTANGYEHRPDLLKMHYAN